MSLPAWLPANGTFSWAQEQRGELEAGGPHPAPVVGQPAAVHRCVTVAPGHSGEPDCFRLGSAGFASGPAVQTPMLLQASQNHRVSEMKGNLEVPIQTFYFVCRIL